VCSSDLVSSIHMYTEQSRRFISI